MVLDCLREMQHSTKGSAGARGWQVVYDLGRKVRQVMSEFLLVIPLEWRPLDRRDDVVEGEWLQ
jgi:hypothetical protein